MKKITMILAVTLAVLLLTGCMGGQTISADPNATPIDQMPATPPGLIEPESRAGISVSYAIAPDAVAVMSAAIANDLGRFAEQYVPNIGDYVVSAVQFLGNSGLLISGEAAVHAVVPFDDYFVMVKGTGNDVILFLSEFTVQS
jgi:hypothetical protein